MRPTVDQGAAVYADWVLRHRAMVLAAAVLVVAVLSTGIVQMRYSADYRVYFGPENPELRAFQAFENRYTQSDTILLVVAPATGDVFRPAVLETLVALTEAAWRVPHAIRVDSMTNFQDIRAEGDDLVVGDMVEAPGTLEAAALAALRARVLAEESLVGRLVAADGRAAGIVITLQFPGRDHTLHVPDAVAGARRLAADIGQSAPDIRIAVTGLATFSQAEAEVSEADMARLVPVMIIVIVGLLTLLLRSFWGMVTVLAVVVPATLVAMGIGGWLGIAINPSSALAPVVIMTLAVADGVHLLMTAYRAREAGATREAALIESFRHNARPVFVTSLTTTVGFLSLNASDSPPFADLGNLTAFGSVAAWALSMTVLPALAGMLPLGRRSWPMAGRRWGFDRFGAGVVARRRSLLGAGAAVALGAAVFVPTIVLDDRFVEWFDPKLPFRADTDFATRVLVPPYSLEFSLPADGPGGVADPAYLRRLEAFGTWLVRQPEVRHVDSLVAVMKRLNRAMHGDDPAAARLPESRELAAQYLLLYEMSLPYGLDLNSMVDIGKTASRVTATVDGRSTAAFRDLALRAEDWLATNIDPENRVRATGTTVLFVHLSKRNIQTMLWGTAIAFVIIAGILIVTLGSVRLGVLSLLANGLPVVLTFGAWGAAGAEIGIIASIITATSLGLIVDDTVHFLTRYRTVRATKGPEAAMIDTFDHVGPALVITTVVLAAGFMVLVASDFQLNVQLGAMTAATLVFALVVDFVLLAPLVLVVGGGQHRAAAPGQDRPATPGRR